MSQDIRIVENPQALARTAADEFLRRAAAAVRQNGTFSVALSGGSTPKALYSLLATDPVLKRDLPWKKTHVFWGDERPVPPDHADSNFRMADEALLSKVSATAANVHRIEGELAAEPAAADYERALIECFGSQSGEPPRFDLVLLGLGPEGHTASLFPGTLALHEKKRLAVANWVGKFDSERITLTAPVFNNAACVIFLVSGNEKAVVLKSVLEGRHEPEQLPAQLIRPGNGELIWMVDAAAGKLLQDKGQKSGFGIQGNSSGALRAPH
ncbi:MAG TPA: 6-phosphogluconolactonase [Burkholderiales bacterium]|nr:6-phosphogluconolactonase [Burkholderiales bacterium]